MPHPAQHPEPLRPLDPAIVAKLRLLAEILRAGAPHPITFSWDEPETTRRGEVVKHFCFSLDAWAVLSHVAATIEEPGLDETERARKRRRELMRYADALDAESFV